MALILGSELTVSTQAKAATNKVINAFAQTVPTRSVLLAPKGDIPMFETQTAAAHVRIDELAQVAEQTAADLQSKIDTLHANLDAENALNTQLTVQLAQANALVDSYHSQLISSQSTKVYDGLDSKVWHMNSDKVVGGSGLGTSAQTQPGIETAEFSIKPQVGQYYDVYCTLDFPLDDAVTRYKLETEWMFPTQLDANASQCLEMEARQVFNGHMYIVACQLQFSGNHLRYWDAVGKWTASSTAQPRLVPGQWYHVILEGHRDAATVYHDAITINGAVTKLGTQYAAQPTNWRTMLRCALQLDGNGRGDAYRVKRQNTRFTVSQ